VRKLAPVIAVAAALVLAAPGSPHAAGVNPVMPAYAGTCGLPRTTPLWMDFGWPDFAQIFGRPGVILSGSSGGWPAAMRATGADTVYWDMHLNARVGQPTTPADPSTIVDKANRLYDYAVQEMGCSTPVIIENELFGANLPTPWSDTNAQYRQNVLTFLQQLAARGAFPMLLINSDPYTGNDAAVWWQQVASVSDIIREAYIPATVLAPKGPIIANRILRTEYRDDIAQLTSIGIPPQRIGLITTMATTIGFGGRNGLQPAQDWFDVVKWQALSMREVAAETGISTLWSWGWGEWSKPEQDPAKHAAACVWLWARNPHLCDGPAVAGKGFDASRTEGQILLSPGMQCRIGKLGISNDSIQRLQLVTGDRDTAYTAIFARFAENLAVHVSPRRVITAERALVASHFGGSRSAYLAALRSAHASLPIARAIIADELRRDDVEATLRVPAPNGSAVQNFYTSYPDLSVREVRAKPAPSWLGGRTRGLAISDIAPDAVFRLKRTASVGTPLGSYRVAPLGDAVPLGSIPLSEARPAIVSALRTFAQRDAYERWSEQRQRALLGSTICARDDLPQPATIDLSTYLPFLALEP
jgi:hypothetical protein